jgi:hypothetical protein
VPALIHLGLKLNAVGFFQTLQVTFMKKLFLVSLLLTSAGIAQADSYRLVNADGADLSAICIAAVTSREAMYNTAAELGVSAFNPSELRCNGMTLSRFLTNYRNNPAHASAGYVFNKSDDSAITELCVAAVSSEQEFMKVKELHFGSENDVETKVMCNGMPLKTFARKYRAPARTLSLR